MSLATEDSSALRALLPGDTTPFGALSPAAREELLSEAVRHGLLGAVVGRIPAGDGALRRRFERLAAGARLRDARLREALEEVLAALSRVGIVPVALKGPLLADRIHPDPALRAATDLDLLVAEEELDHAVAALAPIGYRQGAPIVEAFQRRRHHHVQLARAPGPAVEVHFRAQSGFGARFSTAELLARSLLHRTTAGTPVRILAPEDELLALCVHAAVHLFARDAWLLDLLLFLERHPRLDWGTVEARADAFRCRRSLAWTLLRLRELGSPVPAGHRLLALDAPRRRLGAWLSRAALARSGRSGGVLRIAFQLVLRDRAWEAPAHVAVEGWWMIRRRVHAAAALFSGRSRLRPGARR